MGMYRIAIVVLGLVLLPQYAAALDGTVPVLSKSASSTLRSAPVRSAKAPQPDAATGVKRAVFARGDDTVPGIGDRELSAIRPGERTTPAGRFVAERGMSTRGVDVVWVDYDSGVSLHRVITSNPRERRLERLATPTPADNRISYGCINVPAAFYNKVVSPSFGDTSGIVYVLPETRPVREVFGSYDVEERHQYAAWVPQNATVSGALPTRQ